MGKWNRRYMPRSNRRTRYRDYDWSPPRETYRDPEFGVWEDNVPLWEKKFCFLAGVPWERVLCSKKFFNCHSNVVDWDDAAAKEAFHSAKEQYWAKINGGQNEVHLPDPDLYIDDVDWNPCIDPELVKDLDRTFFVPDDDQRRTRRNDTLHRTMVNSGGSLEGHDGRLSNGNAWGQAQASETLKDKEAGWNQWDESVDALEKPDKTENSWEGQGWDSAVNKNEGIDSPWERYHAQANNPALKDQGPGWSQRDDRFNVTVKESANGDPWECPNRSGGANVESGSWGDAWPKKCDWKPQTYGDMVKTAGDDGNKWRNEKTWREFGGSSRGRNHWEPGMNHHGYRNSSYYHAKFSYGGPPRDARPAWGNQYGQYGGPGRGSAEFRDNVAGTNRKRQGSGQYVAGHKGPRLHYVDQTSRGWNSGSNNNRRVSFAGQ